MIFYDNSLWIVPVFSWWGTVWTAIKKPMCVLTCYLMASYAWAVHFETSFGQDGPCTYVIGGTLSFLLIFRANQAYTRYWDGRTYLMLFFTNLRDFLMLALLYLHGTKEKEGFRSSTNLNRKLGQKIDLSELASGVRVDLVRLCVAYAIILKLHSRIAYDGYCFGWITGETKWLVDWDRLRLMQLLKEEEFNEIDRCIGIIDDDERSGGNIYELIEQFRGQLDGPPSSWPAFFRVNLSPACRTNTVIIYFIREILFTTANDVINSCPWGIKERFVPSMQALLAQSQHNFELINQIICTPLPMPYACLCKSLLVIFLASLPSMLVDYEVGWFGSICVPLMVALALLGIDATATELENPFGDDANDLDILELIAGLEHESLEFFKMCGDWNGRNSFCLRTLPSFVAANSCKPLSQQLACTAYVADIDIGDSDVRTHRIARSMSGSSRSQQSSFNPSDDDI